jgi:hypothetical protein
VIQQEVTRLIKVGVTIDPFARLTDLQVGSPYPLRFLHILATPHEGFDIEDLAHERLEPFLVRGEWFRCHPRAALSALEGAAGTLGEPVLRVTQDQAALILQTIRSQPVGLRPRSRAGRWVLRILLGILGVLMFLAWLGKDAPSGGASAPVSSAAPAKGQSAARTDARR